jgi:hypothetical protein
MKHTLTLCILLLCAFITKAQSYDSALRYRLVSPTYLSSLSLLAFSAGDSTTSGLEI